MNRLLATLTLTLCSFSIVASESHICRSEGLTRAISVEYEFKGWDVPCKVKYDKQSEGIVEYPWAAESSPGYCEDRARFLADKLTNLYGWDCRSEEVEEED